MRIARGAIVLIELDPARGHERFPLVCVVPITGTAGEGALYPPLAPGRSGLTKPSFALIDQLRSIDKRRLRRVFTNRLSRTGGY